VPLGGVEGGFLTAFTDLGKGNLQVFLFFVRHPLLARATTAYASL
jgi:hypothetical protein